MLVYKNDAQNPIKMIKALYVSIQNATQTSILIIKAPVLHLYRGRYNY